MSSDREEVYDSTEHSFCDRCEGQVKRVFSDLELEGTDRQILNGLHIYALGYYGGFWDTLSYAGESGVDVTLCHDCCIWLCSEIPAFAKEAKGGHGFDSDRGDKRCCEYAGDWADHRCKPECEKDD